MSLLRRKLPCSRATTERILAEVQQLAGSLADLRQEVEVKFESLRERIDRMEQGPGLPPATLDAVLAARSVLSERLDGLLGGAGLPPRRLAGAPPLRECLARLELLAPRAFALWREALDANAQAYEGFPVDSCSVAAHPMAERFRQFVQPHLRGRVLDVGCGPQPVPLYLAGYPADRISGLDPLSREDQHPFDFAAGVAEFLPWEDAQFDTVIAATSLDHVLLLDRALGEMARVLKPGGRCLLWVSFVAGARPYDPHADDLAMIDPYHLFHFDGGWFFELLGKHFDVVESLETTLGCRQCFCALSRRAPGGAPPEKAVPGSATASVPGSQAPAQAPSRDPQRVEAAAWLQEFRARHGRAPRILHVGNIANNAYNNAKLLNEAGLDCDVLCYDYYHIMGCPEWEDADFEGAVGDHFHPQWGQVDLGGFQRPRWFVQGPLWACLRYLIAQREGHAFRADFFWQCLEQANTTRTYGSPFSASHLLAVGLTRLRQALTHAKWVLLPCLFMTRRAVRMGRRIFSPKGNPFFYFDCPAITLFVLGFLFWFAGGLLTSPRTGFHIACLLTAPAAAWFVFRACRKVFGKASPPPPRPEANPFRDDFDVRMEDLIAQFETAFPGRADRLSKADLSPYRTMAPLWKRLFAQYDLVQAYATNPILPLLAGKRPYIGFEHGTLRTFTLEPTPLCRTTALAYHLADHVFITNGDCVDYARKIGVTRMSPMLHPVNDRAARAAAGESDQVRAELGARFVFLCTLRHDWQVKGTDKYIRALAAIRARIGDDFRVIMTEWGQQVHQSKALAESLGVSRFLHWTAPFPRRRLLRLLESVDVLFDQIALPHFGATAPEGIAAGVPVIMSYDPASTRWIIPEPAPILSAWTEQDIALQVALAVQPAWREGYRQRAQQWIDAYQNTGMIVRSHLEVYRDLLEGATAGDDGRGRRDDRSDRHPRHAARGSLLFAARVSLR